MVEVGLFNATASWDHRHLGHEGHLHLNGKNLNLTRLGESLYQINLSQFSLALS